MRGLFFAFISGVCIFAQAGEVSYKPKDFGKDLVDVSASRKTINRSFDTAVNYPTVREETVDTLQIGYNGSLSESTAFRMGLDLESQNYGRSDDNYGVSGLSNVQASYISQKELDDMYINYGVEASLSPGAKRFSAADGHWRNSFRGYHSVGAFVGNDFYIKSKIRMGFKGSAIHYFENSSDSDTPNYGRTTGLELGLYSEAPLLKKVDLGFAVATTRPDTAFLRLIDGDGKTGSITSVYSTYQVDEETKVLGAITSSNRTLFNESQETGFGLGLIRAL